MAEMSDEELMAQYQRGDSSAFNLLYLRYEKKIYNYFLRCLGDPERSAELFQETFLKLHRNRRRYDPGLPFSTWIFTIASNIAKNEFKRIARSREIFEKGSVDYETIEDTLRKSPEDLAEEEELMDRVRDALRSLPEGQREVIILSKYEGFSYPEIARITGTSVGSVKQKAHRGITALREKLRDLL